MNPVIHVAVSCGVGYLIGRFLKSIPAFFIAFMGGALIDVDHFLDYFLNHSYALDLKKMYYRLADMKLTKVYLIFHSYEVVFLLWFLAYIFNSGILWVAFATGYSVHLILDQIANPISVKGYFLLYRIYRKFDKNYLVKGG